MIKKNMFRLYYEKGMIGFFLREREQEKEKGQKDCCKHFFYFLIIVLQIYLVQIIVR